FFVMRRQRPNSPLFPYTTLFRSHPCGTARMGRRDDRMAVVDPECRVIGVEGLRVADSSVFPRVTNGNLNAPSIMTGEKAADHIRSEEHTSELQSRENLVCRLLLE